MYFFSLFALMATTLKDTQMRLLVMNEGCTNYFSNLDEPMFFLQQLKLWILN